MRHLFTVLLLACLPSISFAQSLGSISGMVYDADDDTAIPGAHVYLANTTIGDISDPNGFFRIQDVQAGTYQLVITIIGYKPLQQAIEILPSEENDLVLKLEKDVYQVGEITVTDENPKQWKRDLRRFKRLFLGITSNRKGCEIENPYVLDFVKKDGHFTATASQPITVINKALGYEVTFLMQDFDAYDGQYRFIGDPFYTELEPSNEKEQKKWEKKREETFAGSLNHFLRSMAAGTFKEDGYTLFLYSVPTWKMPHNKLVAFLKSNGIGVRLQPEKVIKEDVVPYQRILNFDGYLHIFYEHKIMRRDYYEWVGMSYSPSKEPVRAVIRNIHTQTVFNEMGFLNNAYNVERHGYWSWDSGICNWLPFNYGLEEPAG